jgi:hypothetical protein
LKIYLVLEEAGKYVKKAEKMACALAQTSAVWFCFPAF